MTDTDIIKALECCCSPKSNACDDCPFYERCYENNEWLEKEAIDLINRQKAEIERFEECASREMLYEKVKSEAIKEFAERLKATAISNWKTKDGHYLYEISDDFIDNLVKEMVGDKNANQNETNSNSNS